METVYQISFIPSLDQVKVFLIFSILGPVVLYCAYKNESFPRRRFSIFWGIAVTVTTPLMLLYLVINHISTYLSFQSHDYEIVRGNIEVLREQPKEGHAPGDLIKIGTIEIEIDYYVNSPCYHQTISNGGVLNSGRYVVLYLSDGCILKVDVSTES